MSKQDLKTYPDTFPDWGKIERLDPDFALARFHAVSDGKNTFPGFCPHCLADTKHDVRFATCLTCAPRSARPLRLGENELRAAARRTGARHFMNVCDRCGPESFFTKTGHCSRCYNSNGARRRSTPMPPARRAALDDGSATYEAQCLLHGLVAHHARRGLCLGCYDTQGKRRDEVYMRYCGRCGEVTVNNRQGCMLC